MFHKRVVFEIGCRRSDTHEVISKKHANLSEASIAWSRFCSGCTTFVTMVQATDFRDLDDSPMLGCLNGARVRRVLFQGQMRIFSRSIANAALRVKSRDGCTLANAPNQPFRERILPRTFRRCEATVDSVTVPYQISWHSIFWERFDDLLRRPFCRGMLSNIEMQHAATLMRQHNEYKQHSQLQCGNSKEIDGDQLADVVSQKGLPRLEWFFTLLRHQA